MSQGCVKERGEVIGEVMLKKGDGDGRFVSKGVQLTNHQRVD